MHALLLLAGLTSAAASSVETAVEPETPESPVTETIDETTVGDLGGVRVPMGNVTHGTYTLPDGTTATGPICSLALPGQTGVFVGKGSVVAVDGTRWQVEAVVAPPTGLGSVRLRRLD